MVVVTMEGGCDAQGEFLGAAPTDRRVEFTGMSMMKIVGWKNHQRVGQLGSACTSDPDWSRSESDISGSVGTGVAGRIYLPLRVTC